jgi:N-acetylglucosaminyl-diphospho-decaprenol L-rhamnosyltransferase
MSAPPATAVVVTYNSADHIGQCLSALVAADLAVRVVDNASTDRTTELIADRFPTVEVVANPVNVGFAAAVNQGLSGVGTDVVLLVNPDCVLPVATAWELIRTVRGRPDVAVAGPRLRGPTGQVAISAHPFESLVTVLASQFGGTRIGVPLKRMFSGARRRRVYDACTATGETTLAVDWLSGACLAVRTRLLADVGGLDEGYFMYYEDEELCLQARERGLTVLYVPEVEAVHHGGASSDPRVTRPHLYRSMLRFFGRHRPATLPWVRLAVLSRALIGVAFASAGWVVTAGRPDRWRFQPWLDVCRIALASVPESAAKPRQLDQRRPQWMS